MEATGGPLELGRRKLIVKNLVEGGTALGREHTGSSMLPALKAGVLGEIPGERLDRIFSSFPGASIQGCGLQ